MISRGYKCVLTSSCYRGKEVRLFDERVVSSHREAYSQMGLSILFSMCLPIGKFILVYRIRFYAHLLTHLYLPMLFLLLQNPHYKQPLIKIGCNGIVMCLSCKLLTGNKYVRPILFNGV